MAKRENPRPEVDPSPLRQGIRMGITVTAETWRWLKSENMRTGKTYGQIIDEFVQNNRGKGPL